MEGITKLFSLDDVTLKSVMTKLEHEMNLGLAKESHPNASVKMFPTYVNGLPTGHETGKFLSLDLGGTNFRVLLIELYEDDRKPLVESKIYVVPHDIMVGTGDGLFNHIADCIMSFVKEFQITETYLPLGFTFSFPCKQLGLTSAILTKWTKGFKCSGVENEDVVLLLKKALTGKKCQNVGVVALINDTVGCLMSCANANKNCRIGVILGTGTNACYMESIDKVQLVNGDISKEMIINMEWGAFGDNGVIDFLRTKYDTEVDSRSLNAGKQIYEKMISGMYMGELVRVITVDLINSGHIFKSIQSKGSGPLFEKDSFGTQFVSKCESDGDGVLTKTKAVLDELKVVGYNDDDCRALKQLCTLVSTRAAHLASAGVSVLLERIKKDSVTVAVDGTLFRKHPTFSKIMTSKITQLVPNRKFDLMLSVDGSGIGAAIVAAVAVGAHK